MREQVAGLAHKIMCEAFYDARARFGFIWRYGMRRASFLFIYGVMGEAPHLEVTLALLCAMRNMARDAVQFPRF